MKTFFTLLALLLAGESLAAPAVVFGPGGMPCSKYNDSTGADKDAFRYWGQGYLSGINSMKGFDLTRGRDQATILTWIDRYCQSNPTSSYNGAVDSLILEINK